MRNVNYEMMKIVILSGEFYINYEECKSNIFIGLSWISISFILTMRNVNKEAVYKVLHGADSFILTMENAIYI
ncbi:TPA: hypothetical protein I9084_001568 [Clostridium perfringens]|nr:hypothetical protein [Clostridium perfringens]